MKAVLFLVFLFSGIVQSNAQNLDSLYRELDRCIEQSALYTKEKEKRIAELENDISSVHGQEAKYELTFKLYQEYSPYNDMKAKAALAKALTIAEQSGDMDKQYQIFSFLALQNSISGYYSEAQEWLRRIDESRLNRETAEYFYCAATHVYSELGLFVTDSIISDKYFWLSDSYRKKYYAVADTSSPLYYHCCLPQLINENKIDEAEALCCRWKSETKDGSHYQAIMAYYMSECAKARGDDTQRRYWLAISALNDCRNAVMDQASLWNLASLVSEEGDLKRSQKYVEYSWMCAMKFGGHTRTWQVSPVITSINENYREELRKNNRSLTLLLYSVSIMVFLLLCSLVFVYKRNHQLSLTRNELSKTNDVLAKLNHRLNSSNEMMNQVNRQLHDSNRVKDEYIARFLSLCSEYIDKMDAYRQKINRRLKANQYKELLHMTSSDELRETETKVLFANFDAVFLKLYPTFVESFNRLLQPQYHQQLGPNSELTTDMRMAALIRLGIDDSAHIAEFMRLSPNTVYNYRARLKSRASVGRAEFEDRIKEIGM